MNGDRDVPALQDVARRAGVGPTTVSRVINGGQNVSPRTMAAVLKAIEELGYHPSQAARSLKGARSKTIGLIVPSVADPFFSTAAAAIQQVARAHGTVVLLAASDNLPSREREEVITFIQRRIDGLILAPSEAADIDLLRHAQFPVVCFDRPLLRTKVPAVMSDNYGGAKLATEYLVKCGYKKILCVAGDAELFTSQKRVRGHREVIKSAGLPYLAETNVQNYADTEAALEPYLTGRNRIDAIFSIKNALTVEVYKALRRRGIQIPDSIGLVGFDDFDLADALEPPITVVRQQVEHLATKAAQVLFKALEGQEVTSTNATLKVELVERGSALRISKR